MRRSTRCGLAALAIAAISLYCPDAALAQAPPAILFELPASAKADFDQGVAAAQQQNWAVAIRYFRAANIKAPLYAPLLFNLGFAHAQNGQEILALYWLHAYLAAAPQAENSVAVEQLIVQLKAGVEGKIVKILDSARRGAESIASKYTRESSLDTVAQNYAQLGDVEKARQIAVNANNLWFYHYIGLRNRGDSEGAIAALKNLSAEERYNWTMNFVQILVLTRDDASLKKLLSQADHPDFQARAAFQLALRDKNVADAEAAVAKMQNARVKNDMLFALERFHVDNGNPAQGYDVTKRMDASGFSREAALDHVVKGYLLAGDVEGARRVAQVAKDLTPPNNSRFARVWQHVLGTPDVLSKVDRDSSYFQNLIYFQAVSGKFAEARRTIETAPAGIKNAALLAIWKKYDTGNLTFGEAVASRGRRLAAQGKLQEAADWARELAGRPCHDPYTPSLVLRDAVEYSVKQGDLDAAARILATMTETNDDGRPWAPCITFKVSAGLTLARAYIAANRPADAQATVAAVNKLIWSGAMFKLLLEGVAKVQDELNDAAGASETRIWLKYVALGPWASDVRRLYDEAEVVDLGTEVTKAGKPDSTQLEKTDGTERVPAQLADLARKLMERLESVRAAEIRYALQ